MSRLGYEFTPIDVSITTHPKACAAGPEAMGLWLWGQAYAKLHGTGGVLHRAAVLTAWGGKRNIMLAKRLSEAGLWIEREDGDWDIHNFEAKSPAKQSSSAARMRKLRALQREAAAASPTSDVTGDVTPRHGDANGDVLCSISTSLSVSSGSDQGGAGGRPPWVDSTIATVADNTGETFDLGVVWTTYEGSRRDAKRPLTQGDFQKYLGSWAANQKRDRVNGRDRPSGTRARGAEITKQPFDENAPWMKVGA